MMQLGIIFRQRRIFLIPYQIGQGLARERDVFNRLCPRFIETGCNLLEEEF
ncbi:MAG: hypothetical protein AB7U05_08150 [Mangrovibacterium sp.]